MAGSFVRAIPDAVIAVTFTFVACIDAEVIPVDAFKVLVLIDVAIPLLITIDDDVIAVPLAFVNKIDDDVIPLASKLPVEIAVNAEFVAVKLLKAVAPNVIAPLTFTLPPTNRSLPTLIPPAIVTAPPVPSPLAFVSLVIPKADALTGK